MWLGMRQLALKLKTHDSGFCLYVQVNIDALGIVEYPKADVVSITQFIPFILYVGNTDFS